MLVIPPAENIAALLKSAMDAQINYETGGDILPHGPPLIVASVVAAIMFLSALVFVFHSLKLPPHQRVVHVLAAVIAFIGAMTYVALCMPAGYSILKHSGRHDGHNPSKNQTPMFWIRFLDYAITLPLTFLIFALISGLKPSSTMFGMLASLGSVVFGFFTAMLIRHSRVAWIYFAAALISSSVVIYFLFFPAYVKAIEKGNKAGKTYSLASVCLALVWVSYLFLWIFSTGFHRLSVNAEYYAFIALDLLAKPVLCGLLVFVVWKIPQLGFKGFEAWFSSENEGRYDSLDDDDEST